MLGTGRRSERMSRPASMRWRLLALISASHVVGAMGQYSINTLAPFYQGDLELSRTQVGLFFTAFYTGMACFSFPAGWLADRLGVRAATLGGHALLGLWTAIAASAPSFAAAFWSFLLAGIGYSFLNPASTKGVMAWFSARERATAMGVKQTGVPAGGVVTALIAPALVWFFGWRGGLLALGIANIVFGAAFWLSWRDPERGAGPASSAAAAPAPPLEVRRLLTVSLGTALLLVAQMSLLAYVPLYLKEVMGLSPYWASRALALAQVGGMGGRVGWGMASDRLFAGSRKSILVAIGALSVAVLWVVSLLGSGAPAWLWLVLIFLAGVCMIGYQGVSYTLVGEIAGAARAGSALGLMVTVNSIGAIAGTPLFGWIVDATGSYALAWRALGGAVLCGTAALLFSSAEKREGGARPPTP
jgi:ACS family hexuronate transporter-like MFS transporter